MSAIPHNDVRSICLLSWQNIVHDIETANKIVNCALWHVPVLKDVIPITRSDKWRISMKRMITGKTEFARNSD